MPAGRPQKPFQTTWGDIVAGLSKEGNQGRWRITAGPHKGTKFTCHDEREAVAIFRQRYALKVELVELPLIRENPASSDLTADDRRRIQHPRLSYTTPNVDVPTLPADATKKVRRLERLKATASAQRAGNKPTLNKVTGRADPAALWGYFRQQLLTNLPHVRKMIGLHIRLDDAPTPSLTAKKIADVYQEQNGATDRAKNAALAAFARMLGHTRAKTMDDLTTESLLAFRKSIENDNGLASPATRQAMFLRCKSVTAFGLKVGLDAGQIRAALDRMKVLWTAAPMPNVNPKPISRDDLHKLLEEAGRGPWRAWVLLGLNCALHMEELCALKWDDLDLEAGTHAAIREKTRRKRIPRAAVLWPETVAELRRLPRKGPYVFTSNHGTRFEVNTRIKQFKKLAVAAGVDVTFDAMRDGAFTVACQTDERSAKVLAGHACGMSDNYVLRTPKCTEGVCAAVREFYGPFAAATTDNMGAAATCSAVK